MEIMTANGVYYQMVYVNDANLNDDAACVDDN